MIVCGGTLSCSPPHPLHPSPKRTGSMVPEEGVDKSREYWSNKEMVGMVPGSRHSILRSHHTAFTAYGISWEDMQPGFSVSNLKEAL